MISLLAVAGSGAVLHLIAGRPGAAIGLIDPAATPEIAPLAALLAKPARLDTLESRPLFSETRTRFVMRPEPEREPELPEFEEYEEPEVNEEPEEVVPEPPLPPPPPPELGLMMRGVLLTTARTVALFFDMLEGREIRLDTGESFREWRLDIIEPRRSVFSHGDERRELTLARSQE